MEKGLATVVRDYVTRVVTAVSGMKALVLDRETTAIVSMVSTQSQILQNEVFLIDTLDTPHTDRVPHLKAVYYVRPTAENVRRICEALHDPRYGEYHIFFTNIATDKMINQLAEADHHEVVQQVQEMYGDYLAINAELFSLGIPSVAGLRGANHDQAIFDRAYQGVIALLLSYKLKPSIRYAANSVCAEKLAQKVASTIEHEGELFAFRSREVAPLLLIVDRREDAVTPLLNQWTYQAMVHELMGISNSRVDMSGAPGVKEELKEVVLSVDSDPFYAQNMFLNFGDLGANVKALVDQFQAKTHSQRKVDSIADMQAFVENFPEFRKMSGNVSKHVALMSELSRMVDARQLMEVSQVEQELACTEDHASAVQEVESLLQNRAVSANDKLRLVLLYALRYEANEANALHRFVDMLGASGVSADRLRLIPALLEQCGGAARMGDLFSNKSFFAAAKKQLQRGIKGVQNVYTQHQPYLVQTLEGLAKNKLPVSAGEAGGGLSQGGSASGACVCRQRGTARDRAAECTSASACRAWPAARDEPRAPTLAAFAPVRARIRSPPPARATRSNAARRRAARAGVALPVRDHVPAAARAQPHAPPAGGHHLHLWRCGPRTAPAASANQSACGPRLCHAPAAPRPSGGPTRLSHARLGFVPRAPAVRRRHV